eukprot:4201645-Pyramimonas_sp.AAC.1
MAGDYIKKRQISPATARQFLNPLSDSSATVSMRMHNRATGSFHWHNKYIRRLQSAFVEAVYLAKAVDNTRGDAPTRTAHAYPADLPDQAEPGE